MTVTQGDRFRDPKGRIWTVYTIANDTDGERAVLGILGDDSIEDIEVPVSHLTPPRWEKV